MKTEEWNQPCLCSASVAFDPKQIEIKDVILQTHSGLGVIW